MKKDLKHVYELFIRTTPEKLWRAITDPESTGKYFYATKVESNWRKGAPIIYRDADGAIALNGKIVEFEPPKKLVTTFLLAHHPLGRKDRPSRVIWEIEKRGDACKLTLTHEDFDGETATYREVRSGWVPVLSGLKTLLETGEPLTIGSAK